MPFKINLQTFSLMLILILGISACDREAKQKKPQPVQDSVTMPVAPVSEASLIDESSFSSMNDLKSRLQGLDQATIEAQSKQLMEVDAWLFTDDDEPEARALIDQKIEFFRQNIIQRIIAFRKQALKAPNGKEANRFMNQVSQMLALYPAPVTQSQHEALTTLTDDIVMTSHRIEEIRRLRFNRWALDQITKTMDTYYSITAPGDWKDIKKLVTRDKDNIIKQCAPILARINPDALEPMTRNLYDNAINVLREAMGESPDKQKKLGLYFTNPELIRYSPLDF